MKTSFSSVVLLSALLACALGPLVALAQISLELDTDYSPPASIPTDPTELIYSAPAMDHMLEPIKVRVLDVNGDLVNEPVTVIATTILTTNWNQVGNPGDSYDGNLCQHNKWTHRFGRCRFEDDGCVELSCNTTDAEYPLGKVEAVSEEGIAQFPRLLHTKQSTTTGQRRLRFYAEVNGTNATVVTNPFDVDLQAAKLEITSPAQGNVNVNEPMSFTVQTMAEDPNSPGSYIALTTGRHSTLNVDLTIAWDDKEFYVFFPANVNLNQIYKSAYTLAGDEVNENGLLDLAVRKRCVNGAANFDNIVVVDEAIEIHLNFTQTLPYYPWERWPPIYNDSVVITPYWSTYSTSDGSNSPGVALTPAINVTVPDLNSLVIDPTSLAEFHPLSDANFPFKTPLNIQALDANGRVITDGPDSQLEVSVEISPADACLSVDSSFSLSSGEGIFPGSVCLPTENVKLRFHGTSNKTGVNFTSAWTPEFNVTGDLVVAGIFPGFAEINTDLFLAGAADIINKGVWGEDFVDQGREFTAQFHFTPSANPQDTLAIYDTIYNQNTDPQQSTVRAIIGSTVDEDTLALSRASRRHEMPIVGYVAESSELSDKSAHPFFSRVAFGENSRFFAEGAYLASHHWNKVVVIKDSDHPLPVVMYQGFEAHGVQIALEATVPAQQSTDYSNARPLDYIAEQIINSGTRVIYSYTFAPTDIYLYQEAIRLEFAPIYGYQWIGYSYAMSAFPQTNAAGDCATLEPTCTTAFNSTINLSPGFSADLESPYWKNHLYDGYTHVDPLTIPSTTYWRWLSVLGSISKGHDAAVAIFLGAMNIIRNNETITGPKLSIEIRTVSFEGGSGYISFDENGDRPGYSATIFNFNARTTHPSNINDLSWEAGTWLIDPITLEPIEYQFDTRLLLGGATEQTSIAYAPIEYTNIRKIQGYAAGSTELAIIETDVPAAYYCTGGCGGGPSPITNGTIYYWNYGVCEGQDNCVCNNKPGSEEPGYAGSSCQQILCNPQCRNGECIEPDLCQCEDFWTGNDCSVPICVSPPCDANHGLCTGPNTCTCDDGYWGKDCSKKCTCVNGECNDGPAGTGTCSSCEGDFVGANCDISLACTVVPTFVGLTLIITGIVILAVWYIRRMKFRAALANNDWIVDYNDVIIVSDDKGAASSMAFRSMVSMAADEQKQKNVVRNQGKWNGIEVAIKMINKDSVPITTQLRLEVKAMRDIRQQNLASFVGACCDSPNACILMETAPKGSLDDILSSDAINMDWNFKFSVLKDICRGMIYLGNSPIKSHGRLKSSNCVVDNRWNLKITDYGLHLFKSGQQGVPKFNQELGQTAEDLEDGFDMSVKAALLYTAPEILRWGVSHPDHVGAGTIQGDMYSFGVIMVDILTHESPFNDYLDYLEVDDILDALAGRKKITSQLPQAWPRSGSSHYLRPTITEDCDPAYKDLVECIWSEDPADRPTFQQVMKQLNYMSPQKGDLMDNLVRMLEKYSTNLEAVVAERTQELAAEKAKSEELVCRMLPRAIAEQLKRGEHVSAESFECVTIYFSDIVGFTKIAGGSTPLQVVDLLNDLYTCFDAIIDHFDVYKVETIGDAYMVVSGLPLRNGDQHAGEIASMSLHLLSAIMTFRIRHMPEEQLQLRIGIHSGPAVAGVVGLKMPRYCLFGDTVNTASRMESGGLAMKIHMSDSTAEILMKLGGYHLDKRGEREVKGKGVMTTYWLKNKDGYNRPLPTDDMAVSESQHEFK